MTILFECEFAGERYVGFGKPVVGEKHTLHPVADGRLRADFTAVDSPEEIVTRRADGDVAVTVAPDDPRLRFLPPLLPRNTDSAMLSGFMRTHRSKFDTEPAEDEGFVPPNWFFKGMGAWACMPEEALVVPREPVALIEEPEVALVYVNDDEGNPHYAGYTFGNDLCDIGLHTRNPGWNPYCKLCDTALLPYLFLDEPPRTVTGRVAIERAGTTAWEGDFSCGEDSLQFRVRDMMDNLFEYPAVRRPGMVNYVLLGADKASYHDGFRIADGDRIAIDVRSHDVAFANPVRFGA
ncbi:hypothetical protein SAMN04487819_10474 [Actinopolyspora alba]|uniref:Fumarylacetoacetate (FAA) hydrolase family protein n=1 Tax=Actinopolyspora alba TaxID=673379 RepID=A0A1I1VWK1_9ACTN|nr:fumarylacetoacetate (FAA) hydrolase [Actinopolyspora alba]SFD84980.1 hypothetical protein SAMN04487819_10474 [Actinopolyspora alba]